MSYQFWKFVHIAGVFGFLIAHGVSVTVALRLRKERDRERIRWMLQLSGSSVRLFYGSFVVLLAGGIVAGFKGHWWSRAWIWISIGLLVGVSAVMFAVARPYYQGIKEAVALRPSGVPRVSDEDLARRLGGAAPALVATIGAAGLLAILYLMVYKPA